MYLHNTAQRPHVRLRAVPLPQQHLIAGILKRNPQDRLTLDEILDHEFFKVSVKESCCDPGMRLWGWAAAGMEFGVMSLSAF